MRLTAFFDLYEICILLHRCNQNFSKKKKRFEKSANFVKIQRIKLQMLQNLQNLQNFATFWRARSRLYRHRFLQVNVRFAAFFKIYQIILLKFLKFGKILQILQHLQKIC